MSSLIMVTTISVEVVGKLMCTIFFPWIHCTTFLRAFSVVQTLESAMSIESKTLPQKLSAQQLISCETDSSKLDGCKGGEIIYAMDKIAVS